MSPPSFVSWCQASEAWFLLTKFSIHCLFSFYHSPSTSQELVRLLMSSRTVGSPVHRGWTSSGPLPLCCFALQPVFTPLGFIDRKYLAITVLVSTLDLKDASSLLLFVLVESTNGPTIFLLGFSELFWQNPEQVLSAELRHSQRSAERRRRDRGFPRP